MARAYYTLVASLPRLPHFERAEVLPISRLRLERRLRMLAPEDARDLRATRAFLDWHEQPALRTNARVVQVYASALEDTRNAALREAVELRMEMRLAVRALRLRRQGRAVTRLEARTEAFGKLAGLQRRIAAQQSTADLGLGSLLPWIGDVRDRLEQGDASGVDRMLMQLAWTRLGRIADQSPPFGFEQVFTYVLRWDIVRRWMMRDAERATERFRHLIEEVTRDHRQLFA